MKMIFVILFLIASLYTQSWGRDWAKIPIPGAYCGDGSPYKIYLDIRSPQKWAFEFMRGGACWNLSTCWGPNLRTWIHQIIELPNYSILTTEKSPLSQHSMVYFPYCTGDVFAGNHKARYFGGAKIYHVGRTNIEKALSHLETLNLISKEAIEDLVVYGASAGALGSLFHTKTFEDFLGEETEHIQKRLLLDSPGLHFGRNFWDKFTQAQIRDFAHVFSQIQMNISFDDGFAAYALRDFCDIHPQWEVAILQSTLDPMMSLVFGNISPLEHRRNILSSEGILAQLKGSLNCSVWSIDKPLHTFISSPRKARLKDGLSRNTSAREFFTRFLSPRSN